jgi:hypothetical protein
MIIDLIKQNFNIIEHIKVLDIDENYDLLAQKLLQDHVYRPEDRYLIEDTDTHYYLPNCDYSLTWFNIIKTFLDKDVPLWTIITVSNCINLKQQLYNIVPAELHSYMPTIIDIEIALSAFNEPLFDTQIKINNTFDFADSVNTIEKHAISMMGKPRIHRNMLYHQLMDKKLLDKVAVSYNNVS